MQKEQQFFSRVGFLLAAIAMAVGTGNIWRFPRIASAHGGGSFIIILAIAMTVCAVPLLIAELIIGRTARSGVIASFGKFLGEKFSWMGGWISAVCFLIMSYYAVVTGWTLKYFFLALQNKIVNTENTRTLWEKFTNSPAETIFFQLLALLLGAMIILMGIVRGIERFNKIFLPLLFFLLFYALVNVLNLSGSYEGIKNLFRFEWHYFFNPRTWLEAFSQAAWSSGAGWGLLLTYAAYSSRSRQSASQIFLVAYADLLVAILAGVIVIGTVYAVAESGTYAQNALSANNTGLTFIYLTELFKKIPHGEFMAVAFFGALFFAAFTSLISMLEMGVSNLLSAGISRKKAVCWIGLAGFVTGIPSAISLNFLDNQDFVWGVALLISGIFIAYAIIRAKDKLTGSGKQEENESNLKLPGWFNILIYISPLTVSVIFFWWLWQSVQMNPQTWWNPLGLSTTTTIIFQWLLLFFLLLKLKKWITQNFFKK